MLFESKFYNNMSVTFPIWVFHFSNFLQILLYVPPFISAHSLKPPLFFILFVSIIPCTTISFLFISRSIYFIYFSLIANCWVTINCSIQGVAHDKQEHYKKTAIEIAFILRILYLWINSSILLIWVQKNYQKAETHVTKCYEMF